MVGRIRVTSQNRLRPFHRKSTRKIEAAFNLPRYSMDVRPPDAGHVADALPAPKVSSIAVLQAIATVAADQNIEPPLDKLSAIAILVVKDAEKNNGAIDFGCVRALLVLSKVHAGANPCEITRGWDNSAL